MDSRVERRHKLETVLEYISNQLQDMGAIKLILFGSLASGNVTLGSDIDLIVVFDGNDSHKSLMYKVYRNIDSPEGIDILAYNKDAFERIKTRPFFKHIVSTGKVIYERPG